MKTLKIFAAALILVAVSVNVQAQDPIDVDVSATIIAEITTTFGADLTFGGVTAGTTAIMNPTNGNTSNVGVNDIDEAFGRIDINGLSGREVTITFAGIDLTGGDGGDDIAYTPQIALGTSEGTVGGNAVTSGTAIALPANDSYLHIGGSISPDIDQRAGVYSGEMTINIDYTADI